MSVPEEAITAAAEAAATGWPNVTKATMRAIAATMLEAAAPHMTAAERERTDQLAVLAAAHGVTADAIAIAAALANPWASVVLSGAVTARQLQTNLTALSVGDLSQLDLAQLDLAEPPGAYWESRAARPWQ